MSAADGGRRVEPRRLLFWLRRGVWIYALAAVAYLYLRFDVLTLPAGGVSPLVDFRPGAHLLVDRRSRAPLAGDALLFRDDQGRLLLARVATPPAGEARPGFWVVTDAPELELPDSRTLGPIPEKRVEGRVVLALPGLE